MLLYAYTLLEGKGVLCREKRTQNKKNIFMKQTNTK